MALKMNIVEIVQSPYFINQFGKLKDKICAVIKMKSPKPNNPKATTKHSTSFGFITFWLFALVGTAAFAPHFPPSPQ